MYYILCSYQTGQPVSNFNCMGKPRLWIHLGWSLVASPTVNSKKSSVKLFGEIKIFRSSKFSIFENRRRCCFVSKVNKIRKPFSEFRILNLKLLKAEQIHHLVPYSFRLKAFR